jgi:hypothetical protein
VRCQRGRARLPRELSSLPKRSVSRRYFVRVAEAYAEPRRWASHHQNHCANPRLYCFTTRSIPCATPGSARALVSQTTERREASIPPVECSGLSGASPYKVRPTRQSLPSRCLHVVLRSDLRISLARAGIELALVCRPFPKSDALDKDPRRGL